MIVLGVVAMAVAASAPVAAQRPRLAASAIQSQAAGQAQSSRERVPLARDSAERARLELEVRRGFARTVRNRVGLSDNQLNRLIPLSQRYELQRRQLLLQERDARIALRATMRNEKTADSGQVAGLLRTLVDVQTQRSRLLVSEQSDLAAIMTPVQRAKYMALQEQIRRRLEQMRQRRLPQPEGDPSGPPPRRRPQR